MSDSKVFITDVFGLGYIKNICDIDNVLGRIEKLYLNYEDAGLLKLEADYRESFRNKGFQEYEIELYFDIDKLISFTNIDVSEIEEELFDELFNEAFKETELYDSIRIEIDTIIDKYNRDLV